MAFFTQQKKNNTSVSYPGKRQLMNGCRAVICCDTVASDAAAADLSAAAQMAALWREQKDKGQLNIANRPLIFVAGEDNSAAATAAAGLALAGLRASHFSSSAQSMAALQESLFATVGKRLPLLFAMSCQSLAKAGANTHCSHDDYHSLDHSGCIQLFAANNQSAADLTLIGRKIAELSLNPLILAQDGYLTSALIEPLNLPERELIAQFVGLPEDLIDTPTPAQTLLFGSTRRRIPSTWNVDQPVQSGTLQNADSYMQSVAGQRPFFFAHVAAIIDRCMDEWFTLTGRRYQRISQYLCQDADYLIVAQGSVLSIAQAAANRLRKEQRIKVGVLGMTVFRPFPGDLISQLARARKGIVVLERADQPLAEDLPIISDIRASMSKAIDNGNSKGAAFPGYASYNKTADLPQLYSACFGLGGNTINSDHILAAVENMLPTGKQQKQVYLGIDFVAKKSLSPQQEIQQQAIIAAYPNIEQLSLTTTTTPPVASNLFSIRIHSMAGWKSAEGGQDLAQTLFDCFGFDLKASPQHSVEKSGLPTTFYLTADPKSVDFSEQYTRFNTVIAIDPQVFSYCNPLQGLVKNGVFIMQADANNCWRKLPAAAQQTIVEQQLKVFCIDASTLAADECKKQNSSDLSLQFELQNTIFKAAFFKASQFATLVNKTEAKIQAAIDDNQALISRSFNQVKPIKITKTSNNEALIEQQTPQSAPLLLQQKPANADAIADIHRFWNQTGSHYHNADANKLSDPFLALGITPAASSIFTDMTANRSQHPQWVPENCTACGNCYSVCPDSAIPGLINTVNEVFETTIKRIEKSGHKVNYLRRAIRTVEKKYHALTATKSVGTVLDPLFAKAIGDTIKEYPESERAAVSHEFAWFKQASEPFQFALTEPYHDDMNSKRAGSGGLFSITINPNSCTGCMECVSVCEPQALAVVEQTAESVAALRQRWDYWVDLPSSNQAYSRIDNLASKQGVLETLLLDKNNYNSLYSSIGSGSGCGEKTALHLFSSTATALMQPRIKQHLTHIDHCITGMEQRIRAQLIESLDINDVDALETAIDENQNVDLTLARLSGSLDKNKATHPIDPDWLQWVLQIVAKLKQLKWSYTQGLSGAGRANLGMTHDGNNAAAWTEPFPYNPYPFPWASHVSGHAPALALGLFEGHMVKMAEGFKAIRVAELEMQGKYDPDKHDNFFAHFNWHQFSAAEYLLCPPVVSVAAEKLGHESHWQSVSNSLLSGIPIKILLLANQHPPLSNSGCKELGLIAMAHQTTYVHQGTVANPAHLLANYIDGLNYQGPALWNIYASSQPKHGLANNSLTQQSKLAVAARAHPLLTFDPRLGKNWEACISLAANPQLDRDWTSDSLDYNDEYGNQFSIDVVLTFADWALTQTAFSHHFKWLANQTETDDAVLLSDYLELDTSEQQTHIPFIWAAHPQTKYLFKVIVSTAMAVASQQKRDYWRTLKALSGDDKDEIDLQAITEQAKGEMAQAITEGLVRMAAGDSSALAQLLSSAATAPTATKQAAAVIPAASSKTPAPKADSNQPPAVKADGKSTPANQPPAHEPVWIETPDCTSCDECVDIAPGIFQYNDDKKAIVVDPTKGTFEDIVRSAEKCTAVIIHPGTPWNLDEPNLDKLVKRAEQFQ